MRPSPAGRGRDLTYRPVMATAAEGRLRRRNKSKKKRQEARETTVLDLPDHLFERVLLVLGPSPSLVRAAATCRRWCRVVADAGFLARLSSVHGLTIHAGDYCLEFGDTPNYFGFVPYSSVVPPGRFSLDFLPGTEHSWALEDSRGSLLLLSSGMRRDRGCARGSFGYDLQLVVCEPLTRRYQGILWPSDVAEYYQEVYLIDIEDEAGNRGGNMSNFRILAKVDDNLACVFSSGSDGGWRLKRTKATSIDTTPWLQNLVGRVNGFMYWGIQGSAAVLALEEATLEYSLVKFPENIWGLYNENDRTSWVITGEDGALCIVCLVSNELKVFARRRHQGPGEDEWVLEKTLGLQEATVGLPGREEGFFQQGATILTANSRYVLVRPKEKGWMFSIELDTMRVECEHERNNYQGPAYPYELPWPPVLPDDRGRERR
ncbi:hypothetical protein VPH35_017245 [Triticum aestivum]